MNANLTIPFESYLSMETFRIPGFGKWFLRSFTKLSKEIHSNMASRLVETRNLALANKIKFQQSGSTYLKHFQKIKKQLLIVKLALPQNSIDQNTHSIKKSVEISLEAVDELIKIIHAKLSYDQLKKDVFSVSSSAILSNMEKYR